MLAPPVADVGSPAALDALLAANANGVAFVLARGPGGAAHAAFEEAAVLQQFTTFDVANARCFREEERQKILGIIESGFGSCEAFSALVSGMFRVRLRRDSVRLRSNRRHRKTLCVCFS